MFTGCAKHLGTESPSTGALIRDCVVPMPAPSLRQAIGGPSSARRSCSYCAPSARRATSIAARFAAGVLAAALSGRCRDVPFWP